MSMSDRELERVTNSLQKLVGSTLMGAWQPRRDRVLLGIGDQTLLLVPRGPLARMHTVRARPRNPKNPYSFQGAVRSLVKGPLTALRKNPEDRVVELVFGDVSLHLRLTGRRGGLWLLKGPEVVAAYDGPSPPTLPDLPNNPSPPSRLSFNAPDGDWDFAARVWFSRKESVAARQQRRVTLTRRIRRQLARDTRLRRALDGDLDKAATEPEVRAKADALAANLHHLSRGASEVVLTDPMDPEVTYRIAMDPQRPPAWNMERYYGRARRLDRMAERVLEHMDRVDKRIAALQAAMVVLPEADDAMMGRIEAIAPKEGRRIRQEQTLQPWHVWTGPSGQQVLVGRNAKANRRLSFQKARGHDTWLHLRGRPGAHVLIILRSGQTPDLATLLAAAQITLVHAKIAEGVAADVQYTQARNVRSIKGAADGRVTVHAEKVLRVTRDRGALIGWLRDDQQGPMDASALSDAVEHASTKS